MRINIFSMSKRTTLCHDDRQKVFFHVKIKDFMNHILINKSLNCEVETNMVLLQQGIRKTFGNRYELKKRL